MADAFVGCLCKNTSDATGQNTSAGTVPWTFSAEDVDTDGFHSLVTNTGRITIPAGLNGRYGIVTFIFSVGALDGSPNFVISAIRLNGTTFVATDIWGSTQGIVTGRTAYTTTSTPPLLLNTNDFYEAYVQVQDTSVTIFAADTSFGIQVIG